MGQYFIDQYTLLHFAVGIIMYFWNFPLLTTLLVHTAFELIENTEFGMNVINTNFTMWPGGKPKADSNINIIGDTVGGLIGWICAYTLDRLGEKYGWYRRHIE